MNMPVRAIFGGVRNEVRTGRLLVFIRVRIVYGRKR